MAELTVAMTYGNALFLAAKETGKLESIRGELADMKTVLKNEPDFMAFLDTPTLSASEKKKTVTNIFEGKIEQELLNFIYILIDKGRTRHFLKIADIFEELINQEEGIAYGKIISAVPLDAGRIAKFEEETSKLIKQNVRLENEIDKSLIGGVKILINGKLIDASIKSRVTALKEAIK